MWTKQANFLQYSNEVQQPMQIFLLVKYINFKRKLDSPSPLGHSSFNIYFRPVPFLVPSQPSSDSRWNLFLLFGWPTELPATFLGGKGTKEAADHKKNWIPAPHSCMSPMAPSIGRKRAHQNPVHSCQPCLTSQHLIQSNMALPKTTNTA